MGAQDRRDRGPRLDRPDALNGAWPGFSAALRIFASSSSAIFFAALPALVFSYLLAMWRKRGSASFGFNSLSRCSPRAFRSAFAAVISSFFVLSARMAFSCVSASTRLRHALEGLDRVFERLRGGEPVAPLTQLLGVVEPALREVVDPLDELLGGRLVGLDRERAARRSAS